MPECKTDVVRTREETIQRIRRKKHSGCGTTWEKKKRKTESEIDGLCQPRRDSDLDKKKMKTMTELAGEELCLPQQPRN